MNINLQARDFYLTDSLESQIRQKMKIILNRFDHKIRMTRVVLSDINGPKGGKDKRCTIKIEVHNFKTIVVDEVTENMYESISRCSQRAKRAIDKLLSKNSGNKRERGISATAQTRAHQLDKPFEEEFESFYEQDENQAKDTNLFA
jgi:putative sigma-54 modulation protein